MNQGAEMLLARMDSHPEEFSFHFGGSLNERGRWRPVMQQIADRMNKIAGSKLEPADLGGIPPLQFLTDEEAKAIYDKYLSLQGDAFTRYMMEELLREKDEGSDLVLDWKAKTYSTKGQSLKFNPAATTTTQIQLQSGQTLNVKGI